MATHTGFFLSVVIRLEIYVQLCNQRFLETGEVSGSLINSIEQRGRAKMANRTVFFSIINFHAGNLCPILWSTFFGNRRGFRTWDKFHRTKGTCEGGRSQRVLYLSLIFILEM